MRVIIVLFHIRRPAIGSCRYLDLQEHRTVPIALGYVCLGVAQKGLATLPQRALINPLGRALVAPHPIRFELEPAFIANLYDGGGGGCGGGGGGGGDAVVAVRRGIMDRNMWGKRGIWWWSCRVQWPCCMPSWRAHRVGSTNSLHPVLRLFFTISSTRARGCVSVARVGTSCRCSGTW